jgi:hypothetical protein
MRGNPELQSEAGRTGFEDPAAGKRSMWYHIAQVKSRAAHRLCKLASHELLLFLIMSAVADYELEDVSVSGDEKARWTRLD